MMSNISPAPDPMNLENWTNRLVRVLEGELARWQERLNFNQVKALALDCQPWLENALVLSVLTDKESFDPTKTGKWSTADWRMYNFPKDKTGRWGAGSVLSAEAFEYYAAAVRSGTQVACHAELLDACVNALKSPDVTAVLRRYRLSDDFERFVGHTNAPGKNFYRAWNG
jgi:hypothetical protein